MINRYVQNLISIEILIRFRHVFTKSRPRNKLLMCMCMFQLKTRSGPWAKPRLLRVAGGQASDGAPRRHLRWGPWPQEEERTAGVDLQLFLYSSPLLHITFQTHYFVKFDYLTKTIRQHISTYITKKYIQCFLKLILI